jgi:hypothetical protein
LYVFYKYIFRIISAVHKSLFNWHFIRRCLLHARKKLVVPTVSMYFSCSFIMNGWWSRYKEKVGCHIQHDYQALCVIENITICLLLVHRRKCFMWGLYPMTPIDKLLGSCYRIILRTTNIYLNWKQAPTQVTAETARLTVSLRVKRHHTRQTQELVVAIRYLHVKQAS